MGESDTDRAMASGGTSTLAELLEVQFRLMGRDVLHPRGNLLIRLGFTRQAVPDQPWPARYHRAEDDGHAVVWRCGMFLQAAGYGCLLLRGLRPAAVTADEVKDLYGLAEVADLSRRGRPCSPAALVRAGRWFARYEAEIAAVAGVGHRPRRAWTPPTASSPEPRSLERDWRDLTARLTEAGPG